MFNKALGSAVVALAASRFASAQTFTDCNPLDKKCPADPAFGNNKIDCSWIGGNECPVLDELPGTTIDYTSAGALFSIKKDTHAPTMATHKRIFFGRVDVELQAAAGQGIVTSVVLESADLDEIDWEWVGGDDEQVQTNYFGKGDTTTYDRGAYHPVSAPLTSTHMYSIEWTAEAINWIIDGATVRTVTYDEAKGGSRFPQTPMEVKIGTWIAGGKNSAPGTVEWAGGYTDFADAPFDAYYKSISIVDYAGGNSPTTEEIKEYVWTDNSGSWESIKVVKADGSSDDKDDDKKDDDKKDDDRDDSKEQDKDDDKKDGDDEEEDKTTIKETKTAETTVTKTSHTAEATTTSHSSASHTTLSSAITTPPSTTPSVLPTTTGSGSEDTGAPAPSNVPEGAAAGLFASFGGVAAAGVAAIAAAQLL